MGGELVESENIPIPEGWSVIYMHRTLTERPRRILHSARPTKARELDRFRPWNVGLAVRTFSLFINPLLTNRRTNSQRHPQPAGTTSGMQSLADEDRLVEDSDGGMNEIMTTLQLLEHF